jgi:hypothetical protein
VAAADEAFIGGNDAHAGIITQTLAGGAVLVRVAHAMIRLCRRGPFAGAADRCRLSIRTFIWLWPNLSF